MIRLIDDIRFYRTYEGLKPSTMSGVNLHGQESFYRTYEGLKLFSVFFVRNAIARFYRTYEGLKPDF